MSVAHSAHHGEEDSHFAAWPRVAGPRLGRVTRDQAVRQPQLARLPIALRATDGLRGSSSEEKSWQRPTVVSSTV